MPDPSCKIFCDRIFLRPDIGIRARIADPPVIADSSKKGNLETKDPVGRQEIVAMAVTDEVCAERPDGFVFLCRVRVRAPARRGEG
jgi:hypothetical protein